MDDSASWKTEETIIRLATVTCIPDLMAVTFHHLYRTPLQPNRLGGQRPVRETCPRETSKPTPGHDRPLALGAWPEADPREYRRASRRFLHPLLGTVGGDCQETHARGRRP